MAISWEARGDFAATSWFILRTRSRDIVCNVGSAVCVLCDVIYCSESFERASAGCCVSASVQ